MKNGTPFPAEKIIPGNVPCDGCVLCCVNDAIRILPHEDASKWLTVPHPLPQFKGARMLAHKANMECIYLGLNGCTIHNDKPQQCREMDCRVLAAKFNFTQARKLAKRGLPMNVWRRGKDLLKEAH